MRLKMSAALRPPLLARLNGAQAVSSYPCGQEESFRLVLCESDLCIHKSRRRHEYTSSVKRYFLKTPLLGKGGVPARAGWLERCACCRRGCGFFSSRRIGVGGQARPTTKESLFRLITARSRAGLPLDRIRPDDTEPPQVSRRPDGRPPYHEQRPFRPSRGPHRNFMEFGIVGGGKKTCTTGCVERFCESRIT